MYKALPVLAGGAFFVDLSVDLSALARLAASQSYSRTSGPIEASFGPGAARKYPDVTASGYKSPVISVRGIQGDSTTFPTMPAKSTDELVNAIAN